MTLVVGWLIAVASALFGYVALGGSVSLLWVPAEYLIIFGAALGTLVAGNKLRNLKNLFVSVVRIFLKQSRSKSKNLALLCLMFELLQKIKRDGNLALEPDIENPHGSPLFTKYPDVLKNPRLLEFITDYFWMMLDGSVTLAQLETVMQQEIEVMRQEEMEPSFSMSALSDSMPAFGIVAAIVGVIYTLNTISSGKSPGEIGGSIASALVGTLFGVFTAYAIFSPISRILEQKAEEDIRPFEAIKEILVANSSNFSPATAVEYGRKVLFSDQRPSMQELDARLQATTGAGLRS